MSATFNPDMTNPMEAVLPALEAEAPIVELASPAETDFITQYADYADVFEISRTVHEWVAVQLIASALNGKVQIEWGAITYPLDLWILLLSGSGQGRNTATDVALKVIEEANVEGLLHQATWGSKAAFYQQIAQDPQGLYVWPEFSVVLNLLNESKFAGVKEWITDRYDNHRIPEAIVYRKTGRKSDTPPITFDQAPRLNILATSSADWFIHNLKPDDTTGGFIPRWLPMRVEGPERLIPKPIAPNPESLADIGERLAALSNLNGNADLSAVENDYGEWYTEAHERFKEQPNPALSEPFFNRLRGEILKLATVFEVSQSGKLTITGDSLRRAIAVASSAEDTIFKFLPTGMGREGSEVEKIAELIRKAGPKGLAKSDLTRALQHSKPHERDDRVRTLLESERIYAVTSQTKGRPRTVYFDHEYYKPDQDQPQETEQARQ